MINNRLLFWILFSLPVLFSCDVQHNENEACVFVDVESNMKNMAGIYLSSFTDSIQYVPLETYEDLVFIGNWDCVFSEDLILVKNLSKCLLYNYNGEYVSKIGNPGRGPGEYQYVNNVNFYVNNRIFLQDMYDLLEYDLNGLFITKYEKIFMFQEEYIDNWILVNDSLFFGHVRNITGQSEYKALVFNAQGNIKHYYYNFIKFNSKNILNEGHPYIYSFDGKIYFKEIFNDTLFYLDGRNNLNPGFVFSFGKNTLSQSERIISKDQKINPNSMWLANLFQTEKYILLDCFFNDNFPAKRLTPKKLWAPDGRELYSWYNTKYVLGVYNTSTRELVFSDPTTTDNPLYASGLYNDIDAGPRFYPRKQINDSTLVMWFETKQLKEHVASDDFIYYIPRYPEKKKKLEKLAHSLKETDNPVLMIVRLKK